MENLISVRFEKKVFGDTEDFIFKGIRCSQDIVYKLCIVLGELIGSDVFLELEDEESVSSFMFKKEDILDGYDDEEDEELTKEYWNDEEIQDDNIGD